MYIDSNPRCIRDVTERIATTLKKASLPNVATSWIDVAVFERLHAIERVGGVGYSSVLPDMKSGSPKFTR